MNENIPPEPTPTDAAIVAALLVAAWQEVMADRDAPDKVEALKIKASGLTLAASALRMLASEIILPDSAPDAVRRRAEDNKRSAESRQATAKARGAKIAARIEGRRLADAVTKAEAGLADAKDYRARIERAEADSPQADRIAAVAAVAQWEKELGEARIALAEHQAAAAEGVAP